MMIKLVKAQMIGGVALPEGAVLTVPADIEADAARLLLRHNRAVEAGDPNAGGEIAPAPKKRGRKPKAAAPASEPLPDDDGADDDQDDGDDDFADDDGEDDVDGEGGVGGSELKLI